jgi:ATP-dependent DNA helicase RecQ
MQYLSQALDDPHAATCGKSAGCMGRPLLPKTVEPGQTKAAALFLKRSHIVISPRKKWESGALKKYGLSGKIGPDLIAQQGLALSLWADDGWGKMVQKGKYEDGRFNDELIKGCLQMLNTWKPSPAPKWLTCVPSLAHPGLVSDFAKRLAARLCIPFVPAVSKVKNNRPQKEMRNSFKQAENLDGVFVVQDDIIPKGPVLLIDDMQGIQVLRKLNRANKSNLDY